MDSFISSDPRPLAHIPPIAIFDPLEFDRSLPASQYTLIRTEDLKIMYKEISRVQAYLHNLIHHGVAAQSLVVDDSKQGQPAAIERIPSKILSMIFEQLVPPQNDNDLTPIQIPELTDVLLPAQICRSWRETAIATTSLWSSLHFEFFGPAKSVEKMLDIATTCLARAKSNPLSIRFAGEGKLAQCHLIAAALLAHSHQWSNLSLSNNNASLLARGVIRAARSRLSMLRRLEIDYTLLRDSSDTFQVAPNLRIVELINYHAWHDLNQFPLLPWRQLQQITFTGHAGDSIELLRLSPNLQVFKVITIPSGSLVGQNHIHHAFLRELDVDAGCRDSSDWFGELTMPALVSLSYLGETFPGDGITSFVKRSKIAGSLHTFSLKLTTPLRQVVTSIMASTDMLNCLRCMPNLTQLSLHDQQEDRYADNGRFHAGNITSICAFLRTSSVLPKLKRFAITGPPRMSCVLIADMVMGRWRDDGVAKGCARLESVEINYPGPCAHAKHSLGRIPSYSRSNACAQALAILRQYRNDGLRVVGPPVDEYECIECIEEQVAECGFEIDPEFSKED